MVAFRDFSGIRPRASDVRLGASEALTANDVDLRRGLLRPRAKQRVWNSAVDPSLPVDSGTPQSLFRFRGTSADYWMYWLSDVDVAPGPVDSTDKRHYYTGDGAPKMFTENTVADSTPPYPDTPDTKYPYTWFNLGVPAPATAPDINSTSLVSPEEGSAGVITKLSTNTLILNCNQAPTHTNGFVFWSAPSEGLYAGLNTPNIRTFSGNAVPVTCFGTPGLRIRVESVVDDDHVVIRPAGRLEGPIEDLGYVVTDSWRWDNFLSDDHIDAALNRIMGKAKHHPRRSFFLLDTSATLEIANHTLREGDIIRITGATSPLTWYSTSQLVTTPVPTDRWQPGNAGFRTMTRPDSNPIEFTGTVSFVIERDGQDIDPVVPPTADFDVSVRSYVYTYVSALGEESAPSPPTDVVTVRDGNDVVLENFAAPPTSHRSIDRIWIYRSNTSDTGTAFQYVGELAVANISSGFTDSVPDDELDEVLETDGWDTPRSDMHSIVAMPNGIMAGLSGNRLCFSVPGFPHAWPREYEQLLDYEGIGLEVSGSSLYVITKGRPYIATGVHPLQMSLRRINSLQPGIDKRSILNTGQRILYCSPEGLIAGAEDGFFNATAEHYTKEQWQKIVGPDDATSVTLKAWYADSQYILSASYVSPAGTVTNKLVFDFRDEKLRVTTFSEDISAAFADPETGELYFITSTTAPVSAIGTLPLGHYQILRWGYEHRSANVGSQYASGDWGSGVMLLDRPMSFSAAKITCRRVPTVGGSMSAHGRVAVTLYGRRYGMWGSSATPNNDEVVLINNQAVIAGQPGAGGWAGEQLNNPFRIDVNTLVDAIRFTVRVEGPVEVEAVQFAESMNEVEVA